MSTVVLAVNDIVGELLAQGNPTLEPPPDSDRYLQLGRYLTWFLVLVVPILVVIGGVVAVFVIRGRGDRPRRNTETGEPPRGTQPVRQPLIPEHRYPAPGARPAVDPVLPDVDWGPPDPSVWGRPEQR